MEQQLREEEAGDKDPPLVTCFRINLGRVVHFKYIFVG